MSKFHNTLSLHRLDPFQVCRVQLFFLEYQSLFEYQIYFPCRWTLFSFLVSECSDCSVCDCEVYVEKPCEPCNIPEIPCTPCDRPCNCDRPPCKHCQLQCCEQPPTPCCVQPLPPPPPTCCERPPCNACAGPVAVISTVEVIENCPMYEEYIYNDEPYLVETNHTIYSSYNITESELALQQQEIQTFQSELQLNRKGICGGGLFGIRGDEDQSDNSTLMEFPQIESLNQTKGHIIAGISNHLNNKPTKPCQIVSGWACRKLGRYPHPTNCQKYVQCHFCGDNTVYECPYEHAFDGRQCSSDWSTCGHLRQCQHDREIIPDPWNISNYFICIRKKGFLHKFQGKNL